MIISLGSESGQPVAFMNASYAKAFTVPWLRIELAISGGLVRLAADSGHISKGVGRNMSPPGGVSCGFPK